MANIAKVKEIMEACSMPLELTVEEFKEQASYMGRQWFFNLINAQTKGDIICVMKETLILTDLQDLVKDLLERFDKPSESIDDISNYEDMYYLLRHGLVFISEEERRQKAEGSPQYIDELLGALNDIVTNSQQELKELEEERDKLVEEINQKRNQMLQGIEALRSRLAELGAECENILPQRDERIREME
ncbi:hypothetical protein I6E26_00495 [Anaerovibrio lipolyticus]|uniref:hypothetical protein n=1 Tax=Anaerovibrio lipolyticus TaxID=82374 RepID=UPI001F240670|nr:hypothetical protein [Anaerovibrio lipolyticus]MCF2600036.1 hypothetical protein [Anaerovibrio lipolyticus]